MTVDSSSKLRTEFKLGSNRNILPLSMTVLLYRMFEYFLHIRQKGNLPTILLDNQI